MEYVRIDEGYHAGALRSPRREGVGPLAELLEAAVLRKLLRTMIRHQPASLRNIWHVRHQHALDEACVHANHRAVARGPYHRQDSDAVRVGDALGFHEARLVRGGPAPVGIESARPHDPLDARLRRPHYRVRDEQQILVAVQPAMVQVHPNVVIGACGDLSDGKRRHKRYHRNTLSFHFAVPFMIALGFGRSRNTSAGGCFAE